MTITSSSSQALREEFNRKLKERRVDGLIDGNPIEFTFNGAFVSIFVDGPDTYQLLVSARWSELSWLYAREAHVLQYCDGQRPTQGHSQLLIPSRSATGLYARFPIRDCESYLQVDIDL